MNILFFLTPKAEVAVLQDTYTVKEALDRMKECHFSCVPILNDEGEYIGSMTEGDLLWYIKEATESENNFNPADHSINEVPRRKDYITVNANSAVDDIFTKILQQNFVPVVDDLNTFIGIITRREIIQHYYIEAKRAGKFSS